MLLLWLLEMLGHCCVPINVPILIYFPGMEETLRLEHPAPIPMISTITRE